MTIYDSKKCQSIWGDENWKKLICAGDSKHNICDGDSGGPVQCKTPDGVWYQVGITNFGDDYCKQTSGFTRVSAHVEWIAKTIDKEELLS